MRKRRSISYEKRQARSGYLFCLPFIIGFLAFVAYPLIKVVYFSFNELTADAVTYETTFVGTAHYNHILFVDPDFRKTVVGSIGNMLFNVPVVILFSFLIASLLNNKFAGRTAFRAILFLPIVFASGLIATLTVGDFINGNMQNIGSLSSDASSGMFAGSLGDILIDLNISKEFIDFIEGLVSRISEIITMSAVPSIIFLSGMQSISPSIFEAAYISGASAWDVFWKITFPMTSPLVLVNVIYCIVDSFTSASNTAITVIHATLFEKVQYGLGSAMSLLYLALVAIIVLVVFILIKRLVYYYE